MIAFTVAANLMLKLGAGVPEAQRVFGLLGSKSVAGLALFGCGGLVYALLLRRVPLSIAQSFTAVQFVGVVLAESFVLGEPISPALVGHRLYFLRNLRGRPYHECVRTDTVTPPLLAPPRPR